MPKSPDSSKMGASVLRKPIMEKKRRDKINHYLEELKNNLLKNVRKTDTPISRLDKADILEMTVKYVQQLRKQVNTSTPASDDTIEKEYKSGYEECTRETIHHLNSANSIRHDTKSPERIYLSSCVGQASGELSTLQYPGRNSLFQTPLAVSSNNYLLPLNINIPSSIKIPSTTVRRLDYNRAILKPMPIHPILKTESPHSHCNPLTGSASIICSTPTDDPLSEQSSGYSSCHTQSFQEVDSSMDKDSLGNSVNDNSLTFDKNVWRPW